MRRQTTDVLVVGAGSAGCAAAWHLARLGCSVLLVERRAGAGGAHWSNGVPRHLFEAAGIPAPQGAELVSQDTLFHLVVAGARTTVSDHGMLEVRMDLLVSRLRNLAVEAGAELLWQSSVVALDVDRGGHAQVRLRSPGGDLLVRAGLVVDAGGITGGVRPHWAPLAARCPPVPWRDICVAAQRSYRIADVEAARHHLARLGVYPGEILSHLAVAGGYSTEFFGFQEEEVSLLTGSMPADGWPSGPTLMESLVDRLPWLGVRLHAGEGLIPIRRPRDRLAVGPVALLGDAACQIFGTHGSGVGLGLVAARHLADAMVGADRDPSGAAWDYAVRFQRRWSWLAAGSTLFARFSRTLREEDLYRLVVGGLLSPTLARDGLAQRVSVPPGEELAQMALALGRNTRLGRRLLGFAARMVQARALYAAYPSHPGDKRLALWSRLVARVFDRPPDVVF